MKNILLLVRDDGGQEARLQAAFALTRALKGHLSCLEVTPYPIVAGDPYAAFGQTALQPQERGEARNKSAVTARLMYEGVSWDWKDASGDIADCVLGMAALADLIILNHTLDGFLLPDMRTIVSRIVMQARVPVFAAPKKLDRFNPRGRAFIAWDGRRSAMATMRACVPLLQLASDVRIFTARDAAEIIAPTEAATYLSHHDIRASVRVAENRQCPVDQLIAEGAGTWNADYVVMGAYNHGRLSEAFGGVTKRMLDHSRLPLVLGH